MRRRLGLDAPDGEPTGSLTPVFELGAPPTRWVSLASAPTPTWIPKRQPRPRRQRAAPNANWTPTAPPVHSPRYEVSRPDLRPTPPALPALAPRTLLDPPPPAFAPVGAPVSLPSRADRPAARAAGLGVVAGTLLFGCVWLALSLSDTSSKSMAVITATDSRGLALDEVQVLADGVSSCSATPCSVELEPGAHHVEVVNLASGRRAGRSLSIGRGERASIHFALSAPPAASAVSPRPIDAPISVDDLAREDVPTRGPLPPAE